MEGIWRGHLFLVIFFIREGNAASTFVLKLPRPLPGNKLSIFPCRDTRLARCLTPLGAGGGVLYWQKNRLHPLLILSAAGGRALSALSSSPGWELSLP